MIRSLKRMLGIDDVREERAVVAPPELGPVPSAGECLVTSSVLGSTLVVTVIERHLHAERAAELNHDVRRLLSVHRGCRGLVLDLQNVEYLDSSGLNTMLDLLQVVRAAGGNVAIAAPTQQVEVLFKLTRLELVFSIRRTVIEAIETLEKRAA